jgi:hypothetical protein
MPRNSRIALTAAAIGLLMVGQAYALTLTNRDAVNQRLQISEGGVEAVTYEVVITAHQTLDELCPEGCIIALENGDEESFEGYEEISIKEGTFVIPE